MRLCGFERRIYERSSGLLPGATAHNLHLLGLAPSDGGYPLGEYPEGKKGGRGDRSLIDDFVAEPRWRWRGWACWDAQGKSRRTARFFFDWHHPFQTDSFPRKQAWSCPFSSLLCFSLHHAIVPKRESEDQQQTIPSMPSPGCKSMNANIYARPLLRMSEVLAPAAPLDR